MQDNWVDFKAVKTAVNMEVVLGRYQINWLRKKGDELRGRCPIHQGEGQDTFHAAWPRMPFTASRARRGGMCWTSWPRWKNVPSGTLG